MSVNEAWQGRRYKTPKYKAYREAMGYLLPRDLDVPKDVPIGLFVVFFVSSKASDLDNLLKPFIDSLQDKYGFDDKMIVEIITRKGSAPKGKEYITFKIYEYDL